MKLIKYMVIAVIFLYGQKLPAQNKTITPGAIWPDADGNHIQAHGGGIIKIRDTYFWYGEERRKGLDSTYRYVSCYSSTDLINWKFRNDVVKMSDPEKLGKGWILERPKVFFNPKTKKYVMYFHLDDGTYQYARVGISISDKADGNFRFVKSFRPLGRPSRDIGQFIDDDHCAYLIFEDRELGFHIARLSADYMNVEKEMSLIRMPLEGGAIVHFQGLYYAIGSQLSGWQPNPNKYATSKKLTGPWSSFNDIAPPDANTYQSQSTMMLKIVGTQATTIVFMADQWKPSDLSDSRYLWMPLEIGNGKLCLPKPEPWIINVKKGTAKIISKKRR